MTLFITLPILANILQLFYRILLLKLKVNRNFSKVMISVPVALGGLGLPLLEIE